MDAETKLKPWFDVTKPDVAACIEEAIRIAHPVFVANRWKWAGDKHPPTKRRMRKVLQDRVSALNDNCHWTRTGRFCIERDCLCDLRISLELSEAFNIDGLEPLADCEEIEINKGGGK